MKKVSFIFFIFFFSLCDAHDEKINIIVENCKACHNLNIRINEIPFLYDISKDEFIELMIGYKTEKTNNVMHRISKVLSKDDILSIADFIYD